MAGKLTEQEKLARKFRRDLVKPMEDIVGLLGWLESVINENAITELEIADAVMLALQSAFRQEADKQLLLPRQLQRQLRDAVNVATSGQLAAVGEIAATTPMRQVLLPPQAIADAAGYVAPQQPPASSAPTSASSACLKPQTISAATYVPPLPQPPATPPQTQPQTSPSAPPQERPTPGEGGGTTPPATPALAQNCGVDQYRDLQAFVANLPPNAADAVNQWFSFNVGGIISTLLDNPATAGIVNAVFGTVLSSLQQVMGKQFDQIEKMTAASGCQSTTINTLTAFRGIFNAVQQYLPIIPNRILTPLEYATNSLCPTGYPQVEQAITAYLGGEISEATLQTWLAQNDRCWEPMERVINAQRSKPSPLELAAMRRRDILSASDYDAAMRTLGFIRPKDRENLFTLTEYVPGPSDLIRFMVRDSGDDQLWAKYGGDEILTRKWVGDVKKWGDYQGISQDVAKQYWRAHWSIPSPGQLFEFYHRLRHRPEFGGPDKVLQDVKEALIQQDILPYWIDSYLAISFRPLTRVDVRRAYDIGSLGKQDVESAYLDLGYSDKNAAILADFAERLRNGRIWNERAIKQWKAELITANEARAELAKLNYPQALIDQSITIAAKQQRNHTAVKRFAKGQLTRQHAADALVAHGIPADIFNPWLDVAAESLRNSPPVKYFARDIIDRAEAERRLTAFGIEPERFKVWLDDAAAARPNQYAIAQFRKGQISGNEATARLAVDGVPLPRINHLIERARNEVAAETRGVCADALVDRFLHGEFGEAELNARLIRLGIPPDFAEEIVNRAKCKQSAMGKMPSTSDLCNWLELGLVTPVEFVGRLVRLGWTDADASNVLVSCMSKINTKQAKEAAKQAKDDEAARKKAEQQLARSSQAIERLRDRQAKAAEAARKAKDRRENQILDTSDRLAKSAEIPLTASVAIVRSEKARVQAAYKLSIDDAIAAVVRAIESPSVVSAESISDAVNDAAESIISAQDELLAVDGSPSNTTNGVTSPLPPIVPET